MKREVTEIKEVCQYVGIIFLACDFFEPIHLSFQRELHLSPKPLSNGLYAPFGSPVSGGQKPQARRGNRTLLACSVPLRSKVGGASEPSPDFCGMGPPGERCFLQGYQFKWSFEEALADWFEDNDKEGLK